jgi:CRP-like cAMP-binding protein
MATDPSTQHEMTFLRESELFRGLSDDVLRAVLLQSTSKSYAAGELIFEQGEPGNHLLIVRAGVVEIAARTPDGPAVLAYLGTGECIGEVALLTGSARTAAARVPERAEIISISREVFDDLTTNFPAFLKQLCVILARRLESTIHKVPTSSAPKQLEGHLRYFDLALMMQTLIDSKQTGRMRLELAPTERGTGAELFFRGGAILWASMGRLLGAEVVFQLFQMKLDGTFRFSGLPEDVPAEPNVAASPAGLLLESARLQDELDRVRGKLSDPGIMLRRTAEAAASTDPELAAVLDEVWEHVGGGSTLRHLLERSVYCDAKVYLAVSELLDSGRLAQS